MLIQKRGGVRKVTECAEDVNVVSVVQDPPKQGRRRAGSLPLDLRTEAMRVPAGKK